jgi:hypothetical protein
MYLSCAIYDRASSDSSCVPIVVWGVGSVDPGFDRRRATPWIFAGGGNAGLSADGA